ncbi:MAG: adhesin [Bacillaceae bacterium]
MIITDSASTYIKEMMNENNIHTLRITFEGMEGDIPLWDITLDDGEESDIRETINGVSVAIAKEVVEIANQLKLDFEDESLVILGIED